MGKRRSNQNRKKKSNKNALQNSCKTASSVLDQDENIEKNSKNCSLEAREEPSHLQLSSCNSIASCKELSEMQQSNTNESSIGKNMIEKDKSVTTENINVQLHRNLSNKLNAESVHSYAYHDTKTNKLPGEICSTSVKDLQNGNRGTFTNKHQTKPVTSQISIEQPWEIPESDLSEEFPVRYARKNNPLYDSDKNSSTSNFPVKAPIVTEKIKPNCGSLSYSKKHGDGLTFAGNMIHEGSENGNKYSTPNIFKPVFDDPYESINNEGFLGMKNCAADKSSRWAENTLASEASCSGYRNSSEKSAFDGKTLKDTMSCSVHAYENSKDYFSNFYHIWLDQRKSTLHELESLKEEVHNSQLNYNKSQEKFREASLTCRREKNSDNQVVDFFASFTAFLSDATSGIVSVVQAFNIDSYQNKFKEIMELDAEITQKLYKARSQCVAKYHNIEEVMRNFHSDNLSSTVSKISNSLELGKYWEGMKKAYEKDDMPQLLNVVGNFLDNACQPTKLKEVSDSVEKYIDDNPATVDALKSAGRATYGAIDTFKLNRSQNKILKGIDSTTNHLLMIDDRKEIERLRSIEENSPQSKLESQIEEALDHLRRELEEIRNIYFQLFKSHDDSDSDDSECDIYDFY